MQQSFTKFILNKTQYNSITAYKNTSDIILTKCALLETSITGAKFTGVGWMRDTCRPCSCSVLVLAWKSAAQQTYQIHMHTTSCLNPHYHTNALYN